MRDVTSLKTCCKAMQINAASCRSLLLKSYQTRNSWHVSNTIFFDRFAQMLFSRYQKRGFSPFFIEIHIDLLRYVPCDAH